MFRGCYNITNDDACYAKSGMKQLLKDILYYLTYQNCSDCDNESHTWIRDYPITLLRFFVYLYHSNTEFQLIAMQCDFLIGLTGAMYPSSDVGMKSSPKKTSRFSPESISFVENEVMIKE